MTENPVLREEVGYIAVSTDGGEFHTYGTVQPTPDTVVMLYPDVQGRKRFIARVTTTYTRNEQ
jgi:hypothetical protein